MSNAILQVTAISQLILLSILPSLSMLRLRFTFSLHLLFLQKCQSLSPLSATRPIKRHIRKMRAYDGSRHEISTEETTSAFRIMQICKWAI